MGASGTDLSTAAVSPINGGTTAGGAGLGEQPFYGLESFPLSEGLSAQVNLSTGNLVAHSKDLALNAPGLSVTMDRFYNSLSTGYGTAGAKAVFSTGRDVGLQFTPTGATFYGPSGFTADFVRNPDGNTFTSPPGMNADLIQGGTMPNGLQLTYRKTGEKLQFNYFGYLFADTDRNGTGISFAYNADPQFSLGSITDAAGRVTTFTTTPGTISSITDPAGRRSTFTYDAGLRLTQSVDPAGRATNYTYDGADKLTAVQTPGGNWTSFGYDPAGRVSSVSRYTTKGTTTGDAATTTFTYGTNSDGTGRTTQTNPLGKASIYKLDTTGRVLTVTDPLQRVRSRTWTPNSDVETAVDAMGGSNQTANTTRYTYDTANNLTAVEIPTHAKATATYTGASCGQNGSGTPFQAKCVNDPQAHQTRVSYDGNGNVFTTQDSTPGAAGVATSVFREFPGWFDAHCGGKIGQVCFVRNGNGIDTHYNYNANGDAVQVSPPGPLNASFNTYDSLSRLTRVQDGKGQVTTYTYDATDHLLTSTRGSGTVTNTYSADGNTLTQTDTSGANSTYTYDALGRQTSTTVPGATPNTISVAYDKAGNVTSYTDKAGTIGYTYDAANQLIALAEPGGSCTTTPATKCTRFTYNNNGARTKITYPGGITQNTTVDASGRPIRITATTGTGTVLSDLGYSYTAGTTDRSVLQKRTNFVAEGAPNGSTTTYTYDSLGRMTAAVENLAGGGLNASWYYAYDNAGNRTAQHYDIPGGGYVEKQFTYNAPNWLISRTDTTAPWLYDANGNQTNIPASPAIPGIAASPTNTNTVNDRDQVTNTTSNGTSVPFSYTGTNNNNRLTAGATAYQSGVLGQASQTTGGATTAFTRTPSSDLVSMRTTTGSLYYLTDNQGSTIGMVNDQGQKVAGYSYAPYGETRTITGNLAQANSNPYRYTSGYLDTTSNLYKLGHRYYDPNQGRFTQQDPSSQEANAYLYASGDPVNRMDLTGLFSWKKVLGTAAYGVLGGVTCTAFALGTAGVGGPACAVAVGAGSAVLSGVGEDD